MSQMSTEELEGRLNAQREVIAMILAWVETHVDNADGLLAVLTDSLQVNDHQEDPGAVPTIAFAIEGAREREIRLILEEVQSYQTEQKPRNN